MTNAKFTVKGIRATTMYSKLEFGIRPQIRRINEFKMEDRAMRVD